MGRNDSFDPWTDFQVTDPSSAAGVRADASEALPDLELVFVRVARRDAPLALALRVPEPPETEGPRLYRRKRRRNTDWLDRNWNDLTRH